MDIPRKTSAVRNRRIRRIIYAALALAAIPLVTVGLSKLKPAAPSVDGGTLWPDTVKRGPMLRNVHGLGTLVPEEIRWIPATTQGRIERIVIRPGTPVRPDTVIVEMSNPELERDALDAEMQMKAAEAAYTDLKARLESSRMADEAAFARIQSDYKLAKLQADADEQLAREKVGSELTSKKSRATADELANRVRIEEERIKINADSVKAQLAASQSQIEQRRSLYELRRRQVELLHVRAGVNGMLQELPVQVGQQLTPGANIARVADPSRLKAEVKIAETQAKDVLIGQSASIDTRNGVIEGKVIRIDPSVQNGTRTVDVQLLGALPKGAVPDLSVDGTIELERLADVLYVGRPAFGQENSTVGLFKYTPDGKEAVRVQVKFGRSSVNTIEILEGLQVGDRVILSDTSQYDNFNRIRIN